MARKRRHVWVKSASKDKTGRPMAEWCEKCGTDRKPETENTTCHPTRLW